MKKNKKLKVHWSFYALIAISLFSNRILLIFNYFSALALHELAHIFVASKRGYSLKNIYLNIFGVSVDLDDFVSQQDTFAINIAGPLFNLLITVVCLALYWLIPKSYSVLNLFGLSNFVLSIFNLLPIYPLDGHKIFESIIKDKNKFKVTQNVTRIVIAIIFALMFICSCFNKANFVLLLLVVYFLFGSGKGKPTFSIVKHKKQKSFEQIRLLKMDINQNLYSIIKKIDKSYYTIFYCAELNNKYLDEDQIINLAINFPMSSKIADIV